MSARAHKDASSDPGRLPVGTRVGAIVSSYHGELTGQMLESARRALVAAGLDEADLDVVEAPGAYELPVLAQALARRHDVHAVLCFGLVLKGETEHDRYISDAVANALQQVALDAGKPVQFGVLTCSTLEQAIRRAKPAADGGDLDKGREVAKATIAALNALATIRAGGSR